MRSDGSGIAGVAFLFLLASPYYGVAALLHPLDPEATDVVAPLLLGSTAGPLRDGAGFPERPSTAEPLLWSLLQDESATVRFWDLQPGGEGALSLTLQSSFGIDGGGVDGVTDVPGASDVLPPQPSRSPATWFLSVTLCAFLGIYGLQRWRRYRFARAARARRHIPIVGERARARRRRSRSSREGNSAPASSHRERRSEAGTTGSREGGRRSRSGGDGGTSGKKRTRSRSSSGSRRRHRRRVP